VSGTVLGFSTTGEWVPVPNLRLKVRADVSGFLGSTPLADTVTDAHGRYTINENSAFVLLFQTDPESEYRFPCDWYPILANGVRGLYAVHRTWSGNRPPPGWSGPGAAWGIVSEEIGGSLQPVADATVILDDGRPDPPATTNPNGFYMICSVVGSDQVRTIAVFKTGYDGATREFFSSGVGLHLPIHLQLTRR
jgi:hypothetical protein